MRKGISITFLLVVVVSLILIAMLIGFIAVQYSQGSSLVRVEVS